MNEIKAGWKTSEFWVTLVSQLVGALMLIGVIKPDQAGTINEQLPLIVGGVQTVAGAVILILTTLGYNKKRTEVKIQAQAMQLEALKMK